jgi:glutamate synthase (NADPH/NADH) large chain
MVRKCHLNTCPTGIATQDPKFRAKYRGTPEHVVNFMTFIAREVQEILANLGFRSLEEIVGRTDLLQQITRYETDRLDSLDLNPILVRMPYTKTITGAKDRSFRNEPVFLTLDDTIIKDASKVLHGISSMSLFYVVNNTHRTIGAKISGLISRMYGGAGLTKNKLEINLEGTAGQSMGAWLVHGVQINLQGEANDYVGKGLCGGIISIKPHHKSKLISHENVIIGNTCLYGATSGSMYCAGRAGERFGVRNSGANAVVEGAGDHFLEYMTGGKILSLGNVGNNMGSGLTGGTAFFYCKDWDIETRINKEYVKKSNMSEEDYIEVENMLKEHAKYTGSKIASEILANFETEKSHFEKVIPV